VRVVIDTNILLVSLKRSSENRPIFQGLLDSKYYLVITNEILSEYLEIISKKTNREIANNLGDLLRGCRKINYPSESRDLNEFHIYSIKPRITYFSAGPNKAHKH
jgi:rRNA-processing protein FCF1